MKGNETLVQGKIHSYPARGSCSPKDPWFWGTHWPKTSEQVKPREQTVAMSPEGRKEKCSIVECADGCRTQTRVKPLNWTLCIMVHAMAGESYTAITVISIRITQRKGWITKLLLFNLSFNLKDFINFGLGGPHPAILRAYSWICAHLSVLTDLGDHSWCWGLKPSQLCSRQDLAGCNISQASTIFREFKLMVRLSKKYRAPTFPYFLNCYLGLAWGNTQHCSCYFWLYALRQELFMSGLRRLYAMPDQLCTRPVSSILCV